MTDDWKEASRRLHELYRDVLIWRLLGHPLQGWLDQNAAIFLVRLKAFRVAAENANEDKAREAVDLWARDLGPAYGAQSADELAEQLWRRLEPSEQDPAYPRIAARLLRARADDALAAFHEQLALLEAAEKEAGSRTSRKGGRKRESNPEEDRKIAEKWRTGHYKTYAELASAIGKKRRDVSLAIDRDRKNPRKNPPE